MTGFCSKSVPLTSRESIV